MTKTEGYSKGERLVLLLIAFIGGGFLGALGATPFLKLAEGARATMAYFREITTERPDILQKLVYQGEGLVVSNEQNSQPGLTLIQGIWPDGNQVRVIDGGGKDVHRWTADFFAVWPDAEQVFPSSRQPRSEYHFFIQGMWPLKNGSIILNFGQLGSAKLDRCSNIVWRTDRATHHSVTPAGDGNFWIPGVIPIEETPEEYILSVLSREQIQELIADGLSIDYNNSVLLIDGDDGSVLKEFSAVSAVYEAGLEHAIYASMKDVAPDPVHLNDIEVVTAELAAKIEQANEGDLLLSLREMSMLAILDRDDGKLKWQQQGPWARQHDPDITEDGLIEVFNNRSQDIGPDIDTSQIVSFDAASGKINVVSPVGENDKFYTKIMGTHQRLDNGNRLIAESVAGRVFEVTPGGKVVWDYRMPFDDEYASLFSAAMRVRSDYFDPGALSCG